ncbi:MAG: Hpt domain-containing protein, partial [Thermoanaerobaculia bacterium]
MTREDDRARTEFTTEAEELLETLSRDLVELESNAANVRPEVINKIFREVHSLKGLAGMLGFAEISELSHNLEDMLDRLRMGKIEINKNLLDVLYDSVDSLNRLVISINDPSLMGLVDIPALTSRIHQLVTNQPLTKQDDPFALLTIDEQTRKSLTEYEEHRLLQNVRSGKNILFVEVTFEFTDFDERLRALTAVLTESGEVISTLPALDATGGTGISFRLLYGSTQSMAAVAALAPEANVTSVRKTATAAVTTVLEAEEELSLRSISQTVRVDIAKLDHVMNIVGELIIEKTQLEAAARAIDPQHVRLSVQELGKIARNLDRKVNEIQKSVIEMRMVPVGQIYSKLSRT